MQVTYGKRIWLVQKRSSIQQANGWLFKRRTNGGGK